MVADLFLENKNILITLFNKATNINYSINEIPSFHYVSIEKLFIEAHSENIGYSRQINLIYVHCGAWNYIARYILLLLRRYMFLKLSSYV